LHVNFMYTHGVCKDLEVISFI